MSSTYLATETGSVWLRPWRVMLIALGAVVLAALLREADSAFVTPARLLLLFAGIVAGGWAVQRRLGSAGEEMDERVEAAGLVAVYSILGLVGYLGMADDWFSGHIFFAFFILAAMIGSVLTLLPRLYRRLCILALIVCHFIGIATASGSIPATNGQTAWLPMSLWAQVYRPYLTGLYLTNAYHFYAPDPGSSTLVWMRIEYEDGSYRWLKYPNRASSVTPLHYQRQMGLCEATSQRGPMPTPAQFNDLKRRRLNAGEFRAQRIPMKDDMMDGAQFYPPNEFSNVMMQSLVRHVCRYFPSDKDPNILPKRVKIYRLSYTIIMPGDLLQGRDPLDDNLKTPFFMGEYKTNGRLVRYDSNGQEVADDAEQADALDDPFLYWVVPMEYLKYHSGDVKAVKPGEEKP